MADRLAEKAAMRRHRVWRRVLVWVASALAVLVAGGSCCSHRCSAPTRRRS
ncbi:hypothetical protein NKG05_00215 [Oerskovia sp. M15]